MNRHFQFLFLVILFLKISEVKSQELAIYKGKSEFGISGGGNESSMSGIVADIIRFSDKNGISFAAHHNYYYSEKWALRTRLSFDRKGGSDVIANLPDRNLNYLAIAVHPSWHFGKRKRWYLSYGPYLGYLLSVEDGNRSFEEEIEKIDWGHSFFIGYRFAFSTNYAVFVELGSQATIPSLDRNSFDRNIRNESVIYTIGILF